MKFLFDLWFWMITIIVGTLFLFYKPVETLVFIAVFYGICTIIGLLIYKHRKR